MNDRVHGTATGERSLVWLAVGLLAVLTLVGIHTRPLTPIDETRYVGVAWEMWLRGDFLVPFKNGAPYSHKPPLMMWMFQAGWALFGVNDWWPRLVSPLMSSFSLWLTWRLAQRLWPQRTGIAGPATLMLSAGVMWIIFSTMVMFDILVAMCTLIGMHGILTASRGRWRAGFALLGLSIGLGVLAKGPVILLQVLPVAVLAPWWSPGLRWGRWLVGIVLAVLLGALIALLWAVPAGMAGGEAYRNAIFWGQTANRMVESFAHRRPVWWYLPLLPLMLFPWFVWPGLWRATVGYVRHGVDPGGRFCVAWSLPVLLAFSFISGKQPHYLLPIFPAFALLTARALHDAQRLRGIWLPALAVGVAGVVLLAPGRFGMHADDLVVQTWPAWLLMGGALVAWLWGRQQSAPLAPMALLAALLAASLQLAIFLPQYDNYDTAPLGRAIHDAQQAGRPVAHAGGYHDQYQFSGRLQQPVAEIAGLEALNGWIASHPQGMVVIYTDKPEQIEGVQAVVRQRLRGGGAALLDAPVARDFLAQPANAAMLKW